MELDTEKLQPYIERFIEFYETKDYWEEEREYKEKLYSATDKLFKRDNIESSSFKKELFNWLTDKENQQAIINLTHNIPYQRFKYIVENEYLSNEEIAPLFIDLLFNSDGIGKKLGRFRKGFDVLAERTGAGDLQYDLCTLFVAYKYPDDFLVYKRDYMREFWSNFVEGAEFKGRPIEKYAMFSEIAPDIKGLLESNKPQNTAWTDNPKIDMLDVQTFIYLLTKPREGMFEGIENITKKPGTDNLDEVIGILNTKRQIILCGPPGTGKTYVAKKLVKSETGEEEGGERWELIQFHPSYTYEDFVRGLVAVDTGSGVTFKPEDKIFAAICYRATEYPNANYYLIIDEINRADISKVFGELIYGLEYRGKSVATPYEIDGSTALTVPPNLYIIGTMNTADKSIAMLDYALRRRFAFIPMYPDAEVIKSYYSNDYPETKRAALNLFEMVADCFNESARDLAVGHTYFMVGEKDNGGVICTPGEAGKLEPVEDDEQGLELLRLKFIYETAPIIREYVLAGEEGVEADDIKKAYEKGNIEDNLADIFEAWISGRDIEDDEEAEEGETPIEDVGDIGEDSE